jgi:hypothetical protein
VAISLDNLPTNNNGIVDGFWTIQLRQNLNGGHAGVEFRDGRSVTPLDGQALRRFVAAMGPDIVGAYRGSDNTALGDVSTLRPEHYDQAHEKSLDAQSSNKLAEPNAAVQNFGKENEHTDAQHIAAGAKFQSPEEIERRKEFERASGREPTATGGATSKTADGGVVKTGGEPVDPATLPDGDPLKPVPVGNDAKVGEVSVTVDTGKAKETFKGDVKVPESGYALGTSPTPHASSTTHESTETKPSPKSSYSSELKSSTEKSSKK